MDESWLVAIGHGIDDIVVCAALRREDRSEQAVGLDVDHDHMFCLLRWSADRMTGSRFRTAGYLQDYLAFGFDQAQMASSVMAILPEAAVSFMAAAV